MSLRIKSYGLLQGESKEWFPTFWRVILICTYNVTQSKTKKKNRDHLTMNNGHCSSNTKYYIAEDWNLPTYVILTTAHHHYLPYHSTNILSITRCTLPWWEGVFESSCQVRAPNLPHQKLVLDTHLHWHTHGTTGQCQPFASIHFLLDCNILHLLSPMIPLFLMYQLQFT